MTYTAPEILLFIAAIGGVLTSMITAWRLGNQVKETQADVKSTLIKAAVIEGHVNSKETKYVEQLAARDKEIEILKSVIVNKEKVSALLAQSLSNASTPQRTRSTDITESVPDVTKGTIKIEDAEVKGTISKKA